MFKSPEQVVYRAIASTPETARLLGLRVYPVVAPATAGMPFAIYRRSAIQRQQTLSGPRGVPQVSMDLTVFATTYSEAREASDALRRNLDGWGGMAHNTEVKHVSLEQESDDFVTLQGSDLPPVYQITQTYSILWQET